MKANLRYLSYVCRHKWFVFRAGRKIGGIPLWRLLIHDWSKFTPAEWSPYVDKFYSTNDSRNKRRIFKGCLVAEQTPSIKPAQAKLVSIDTPQKNDFSKARTQVAFDQAWLHHQHHNPHHWQHWMLREDNGGFKAMRMPEYFAREMVADWLGAGRAITGKWDIEEWYDANKDKMELHPETRKLVQQLLTDLEPVV